VIEEGENDIDAVADIDPDHWELAAACLGLDPELFFPKAGEATVTPLAVCRGCPVRDICLETHLHEDQGVWGGTTALGRRRIRRQRRNAA
jgi:WhiB family redox-sensing transcriptional regulator